MKKDDLGIYLFFVIISIVLLTLGTTFIYKSYHTLDLVYNFKGIGGYDCNGTDCRTLDAWHIQGLRQLELGWGCLTFGIIILLAYSIKVIITEVK